MAAEAEKRITVATDDLVAISSSGWLSLLIEPSSRFGPGVRLIYDAAEDVNVDDIPVLESLIKNGITLERRDGAGATILSADGNRVILTSARVDSASARQSYSSRIGLAIKGVDVVHKLFGGI